MELTEREASSLHHIADRLGRLHALLHAQEPPDLNALPLVWFSYLAEVKAILGNFSNDLSLVACLLAKDYLTKHHSMRPFDIAEKAQGAGGLDIDERTTTGERVIGEIKTTTPYLGTKFGANQTTAFHKDFAKLAGNDAEHKYMFVTDGAAFSALQHGFAIELRGVTLVCLTTGDAYTFPLGG